MSPITASGTDLQLPCCQIVLLHRSGDQRPRDRSRPERLGVRALPASTQENT